VRFAVVRICGVPSRRSPMSHQLLSKFTLSECGPSFPHLRVQLFAQVSHDLMSAMARELVDGEARILAEVADRGNNAIQGEASILILE